MPFGIGSGAGVIFGVTGGVTEAVLRRLREGHNRVEMDKIKSMIKASGADILQRTYYPCSCCQWTWKCRCADEEDPEGRSTL